MKSRAEYSGPLYLPITAAAKVLGIGSTTCRTWCREGKLPAIHSGTKWFVSMSLALDVLEREARQNCAALDAENRPHLEAV